LLQQRHHLYILLFLVPVCQIRYGLHLIASRSFVRLQHWNLSKNTKIWAFLLPLNNHFGIWWIKFILRKGYKTRGPRPIWPITQHVTFWYKTAYLYDILPNLLMFLSIPTLNSGSLWNFMVLLNLFWAQISLNLYSTICNLGIRTNNYVHGVTAWGCSEYIFLDKINASLCMNQQSRLSLQHHQVMDSILHTFCANFHTPAFLVISCRYLNLVYGDNFPVCSFNAFHDMQFSN
jgi:hypothetical protein